MPNLNFSANMLLLTKLEQLIRGKKEIAVTLLAVIFL